MTLAEALTRAGERNLALIAAGFEVRAADGLIERAGQRPNPTLAVEAENFAGTGALQGIQRLETTVQASQAFERGAKRERRVELARRERDVAAGEAGVRRAELLAKTAHAFVDAVAAQARLELAAEPLRLAEEVFANTERRVAAGEASPVDAARARALVATAQLELARARADWNATRARLAATWSGVASDVPRVAGVLPVPGALPSEAAWRARLDGHPRLGQQRAVVAGRKAAVELTQSEATQDIVVGGGVRFLREGSDAGFVAGVSVPLPVRHRNRGSIRAARETLAGAEQAVRALEVELESTFSAAWEELQAAQATALAWRRDVLPALEEAQRVTKEAHAQGDGPLSEVLEAQRALSSARRELLLADAAFASAHVRLEALTDRGFPATAQLLSSP